MKQFTLILLANFELIVIIIIIINSNSNNNVPGDAYSTREVDHSAVTLTGTEGRDQVLAA